VLGSIFDRLLGRIVSRSFRRGVAGEPAFLVLGAVAWLVVRSRKKEQPLVWSGSLKEGDRLLLTNFGREEPGTEQGG